MPLHSSGLEYHYSEERGFSCVETDRGEARSLSALTGPAQFPLSAALAQAADELRTEAGTVFDRSFYEAAPGEGDLAAATGIRLNPLWWRLTQTCYRSRLASACGCGCH